MATPAHPTQGILILGPAGPGQGMSEVTKSDTDGICSQGYARSLYCVQAGNVRAVGADGVEFTVAVPANFILPVAVTKVFATNTTVTNVYAIW